MAYGFPFQAAGKVRQFLVETAKNFHRPSALLVRKIPQIGGTISWQVREHFPSPFIQAGKTGACLQMLQDGMDKNGVGTGRAVDPPAVIRPPGRGISRSGFLCTATPHNETESAAEISGGALLLRQFFHHHHIRIDFF